MSPKKATRSRKAPRPAKLSAAKATRAAKGTRAAKAAGGAKATRATKSAAPAAAPTPATLVFVHGAGAQCPEPELRDRVRTALVLPPGVPIVLAYYAHVLHSGELPADCTGAPAAPPTPASGGAGQLAGLVEELAREPTSLDETARAIVDAVLSEDPVAAPPGRDREAALQIVRELYGQANTVARRHAALTGAAAPDMAAEPRMLAGGVATDVTSYFLTSTKYAMRKPLVDALAAIAGPVVVLGHSLGSVIAHDVLCSPGIAPDVRRFVTIGSPLGLPPVQALLVGCSWGGLGGCDVPGSVPASGPDSQPGWFNGYDVDDIVPMGDPTMEDDFDPGPSIEDGEVQTTPTDPHELVGYLSTPTVRARVHGGLGIP